MHTVTGMLLFGLLFTYFFEVNLRKLILVCVYAGYALHFILDALQQDIFRKYFWFYPFSRVHIGFDLFGIDDSIRMMPVLILIIIMIELGLRLKKTGDR
jgi:hypothetical protein